jgi:ABC-type dipeptide/oligopeptide/nickel transport system ATPase component
LAIIGESGSGKTTLADIIAGINSPTSGKILFNSHDEENEKPLTWPRTGYVSQSASLFGTDIYENVSFGSHLSDIDVKRVDRILSDLNLSYLIKENKYGQKRFIRSDGTNLSGGERQRVAIARVEFSNPDLIIFDEPASALDEENRTRVIEYIQRISGKKTIILVTHALELLSLCETVLELKDGKVNYFGPVDNFKK